MTSSNDNKRVKEDERDGIGIARNLEVKNDSEQKVSDEAENYSSMIGHHFIELDPEQDDGHVEYKLQLLNPSPERFEKLVTQMKWVAFTVLTKYQRLSEGSGEAVYHVGIEDNGFPRGLSRADLDASIVTVHNLAEKLEAEATVLLERKGKEGFCAEVLVRKHHDGDYIDVRVAVAGNVDSGKSTLVGCLARGVLDNGRGSVRTSVFNYKHEIESGRTSSISHQLLGFDVHGNVANYNESSGGHTMTEDLHSRLSWAEIISNSAKVCSFFDLAGHEKYLKTTCAGLTGQLPDYQLLLVGSNMGVQRMTKEHFGLALALRVPVAVVFTKIDMAPKEVRENTENEMRRILKLRSVRRIPLSVRNEEDVMLAASKIGEETCVPFFWVSSVSGKGIDLLKKFLNLLPPRIDWAKFRDNPASVSIDETYTVVGVGTVVGGTVLSGQVRIDDTMLLGPDNNGNFQPVYVKSIHCKRIPVKSVTAGQAAGFALRKVKRHVIRKGMFLVAREANPRACWEFEANLLIYAAHHTTIKCGYEPVMQCLNMRASVKIIHIQDKDVLRSGDRATCRLRFLHRPALLQVGLRIIFREGFTKGMGVITKIISKATGEATAEGVLPSGGGVLPIRAHNTVNAPSSSSKVETVA